MKDASFKALLMSRVCLTKSTVQKCWCAQSCVFPSLLCTQFNSDICLKSFPDIFWESYLDFECTFKFWVIKLFQVRNLESSFVLKGKVVDTLRLVCAATSGSHETRKLPEKSPAWIAGDRSIVKSCSSGSPANQARCFVQPLHPLKTLETNVSYCWHFHFLSKVITSG